VAAAAASGLAGNDDFNATTQDGVGLYQLTQRSGRRWSAADGYLRPAIGRANLTVATGALATRVLVEDGRAVGVRYLRDRAEREARAGREVILSGGAVGSPQLLMLSGVGPADHLREHGIPVILDAAGVGDGLQDHPICLPEWHTPTTRNLWEEMTPGNLALWQREGRGPMASSGAEAGGFARTGKDLPAPDLQFGLLPGPAPAQDPAPPNRRAVATIVFAVTPGSRGRIRLRSTDPRAEPLIDPAYLADEARPGRAGHGGPPGPGDRRMPAAGRPDGRGVRTRRAGRRRQAAAGVGPRQHRDGVPPELHLRHGRHRRRGLRSRPARPRRRGVAGGRRLGDAGGAARQHQRPDHRHRRTGRRPDPRQHPVGTRSAGAPGRECAS
jgi:choline dehydrogenase-like flavoprotein